MISDHRHSPFQWTVAATVYFLAASCAGNPSITTDLRSGGQVCLALDWDSASPPDFFGWAAPDTMLLLPKLSKPIWEALQADAEGKVDLTASQFGPEEWRVAIRSGSPAKAPPPIS
jgi:hypothetical protein